MELRDYLLMLRRNWVIILAFAIAGTLIAGVVSMLQPATFRATATVLVATSSGGSISEMQQASTLTEQRARTYAEMATKAIVLDAVAKELGLATLSSRVSVNISTGTALIEIAVIDENPALAAQVADALASNLSGAVKKTEPLDSPIRLQLVDDPAVPTQPISPNVRLNLALGLLLGLAFGVGLGLVREMRGPRVRDRRDVEAITARPVIGEIVDNPKARTRALLTEMDADDPRRDSFRKLRTDLQFVDSDRRPRGFVITSSIEAEGKSTTTANLAITLAKSGLEVLLVNADFRQKEIERVLGIAGTAGLSDVLVGRLPLVEALHPWTDRLQVLPAGAIPPNPGDLLDSSMMSDLVRELGDRFDVVLYDAPPLLSGPDAALLSRGVGGAIVVASAGRVRTKQLAAALATLDHVDAQVSGIVLTMLRTRRLDEDGHRDNLDYRSDRHDAPLRRRGRAQRNPSAH